MTGQLSNQKLLRYFVSLNVPSGTASGIIQFIIPLYALQLNATSAQLGLIKGISGIGFLLLVLPAGFLVDRYGTRRLFLTGSICSITVIGLLALVRTPALLIFLMAFDGFFRSLMLTSLNSSFFRNLKKIGFDKAGWFRGSTSVGFTFLGPLLGGYLTKTFSNNLIVGIAAGIMLVPLLLMLLRDSQAVLQGPGSGLSITIGSQLTGFKKLLRLRAIYLPLLAEILGGAIIATFGTFIIVMLVRGWHLKPTTASYFITLQGGVFILALLFGSPLIHKLSLTKLYCWSFGIAALGLLGISTAGNLAAIALATVLLGFSLGVTHLVTSTSIGEIAGETGIMAGLFAAARGVGLAFGPLTGGLVGQYLGSQLIFLMFVPFLGLLAVYVVLNESPAVLQANGQVLNKEVEI